MMDRSPEGIGLPPELADLDAELSSIRYEERPSFGPELEAELLRAHREAGPPARRPKRQLMAAGIAGILMAGMSVPSARASLARFVERLQEPEAERGAPSAPPASRMLPALELTPPSPVVGVEPPSSRPGTSFPVPDTPRPGRNDVPEVTFPELVDRGATEELIRRHYPIELQEAGVGGTVRLRLWVDSTGSVEAADLGHSSGVPALDRVALEVAPSFEFEPARRRGRAVGTPVEFDVRFAPRPAPGPPLPEIPEAPEQAGVPDLDQRTLAPVWRPPVVPSPEGAREAGDRLRAAIGDEALVRRLGSIDAILAGDPPPGAPPTRWRAEVSEALEAAMLRDPDNAAPLLALARIRRKQGLKTEARVLFERGLQKALRGGAGSPAILAELHYERALLVRESWLAARGNGRVRAEALTAATCPQARSSGGVASGYASAERLIAWNYLCPIELARVFASSFEADRRGSEADRKVMMASLDAAVEASPGHVGANVEWLLGLAESGEWQAVLDGARRFGSASQGHPYAGLLEGLALQRLGRSEGAQERFSDAVPRLTALERSQLEDPTSLLDPEQAGAYLALGAPERDVWLERFWGGLDPILSTDVNERSVEHLARASYALLRYGSVTSDPGRVWVRYGQPDRVRVVGEGSGSRTEFWDFGTGPDLTFRGLASESAHLSLTPEGRAYVDDLRRVLPHRYGARARPVFPLEGQVSRFRAQRPGATLVAIHADPSGLPERLRGGSLEVNVFMVAPDGTTLSAERGRTLEEGSPLAIRVEAGPRVEDVVVEVRDRTTGAVASLRERAHRADSDVAEMSDLLLVRSAYPAQGQLHLNGDWVRPISGPVLADVVGVLFELYDVAAVSSWYRLRAEVEDLASGHLRSVPVEPAGEVGFRPTWDRHPAGRGPTPEFLNVWVGEVPPGRYRLRVWADLPEAGIPLVAERTLVKA